MDWLFPLQIENGILIPMKVGFFCHVIIALLLDMA